MGGAAGFSPAQVKEMSIWEFLFAADGWRKANGGDEEDAALKPPTEDEYRAALAKLADS